MFDALSAWDELHPLVVHFPIALLLVAPVFVVLGVALRDRGRPMLASSLLLMVLGTLALFVAVSTGEAAGEAAERLPNAEALIERHEELAEVARALFTALTAVFAVWLIGPLVLKRKIGGVLSTSVNLVFLVAYLAASAVLVNVGHEGGQLVHQFGLHSHAMSTAQSAPGSPSAPGAAETSGDAGHVEDDED